MIPFGFTQKKFISLSEPGRHKHIIAWLARTYQSLMTGRVTPEQWAAFLLHYKTILAWTGRTLEVPACPAPDPGRACLAVPGPDQAVAYWQAYLSDAIHQHRKAAGLVLRDPDLLPPLVIGDRQQLPALPRPRMDYQVALDGIRSLFNVGSIIRTCEAAGIQTLILGNTLGQSDPRVRKTAMGAQDRVAEEFTHDLAAALQAKKAQGFTIIGVDTSARALPCHTYQWPEQAVVVLGNEEYGISPHVRQVTDQEVCIPMFGMKNSLNVANAAAVVLFQAIFSLNRRNA